MNRWRGLVSLVRDSVEHGSIAIEKLQKQSAGRPFRLLEQLPPIALPVRVVHAIHDGSVTVTHTAIRLANRVVAGALDVVLPE